ncbi:MAG: NnrU family protein [Desulfatiglandaceae bacterium]|jgi:methanethiol S-methyltransferase
MNPYVGIFLIMACFGTFHTLTARQGIKSGICSKMGIGHPAYTIMRSSTSLFLLILSLVALFRYAQTTRALFSPVLGLPAIVPTMFAFWIAGMALGQVAKGRRLPQLFDVKEYPKVFFFSGAYSICRHPMYAGWLIASWGILLSKPYLLTVLYNTLITLFVVYESLQEEKRMTELFGDKYLNYKKEVPFLIPYGFLKSPDRPITGE